MIQKKKLKRLTRKQTKQETLFLKTWKSQHDVLSSNKTNKQTHSKLFLTGNTKNTCIVTIILYTLTGSEASPELIPIFWFRSLCDL